MKWVRGDIANQIKSECGRFRILRTVGSEGQTVFIAFELWADPVYKLRRRVIPGDYKTADEARAACEAAA